MSPAKKIIMFRKLVGAAILACALWWLAGWIMEPSAIWGAVFTGLVVLVLLFVWLGARASSAFDDTQEQGTALSEHDPQQLMTGHPGGVLSAPDLTAHSPAARSAIQKDLAPAAAMGRESVHALPATAVRIFASVADGQNHGWDFGDVRGSFGGDAIHTWARHADITDGVQGAAVWEFDGLSPAGAPAVVPETIRVFGRLRYRRADPAATP